jgi:DNA polymerase-3 subunit alpha
MKGGVTWDYAKRKHDADPDEWYWHPRVEPILEETYGLVSYQEQVMEISKQLGGFSGAEADDLRKAMGKLYRIKGGTAAKDFMSKYEEKWFAGCVERGVKKNLPTRSGTRSWSSATTASTRATRRPTRFRRTRTCG